VGCGFWEATKENKQISRRALETVSEPSYIIGLMCKTHLKA
jgi:hypothetical protein